MSWLATKPTPRPPLLSSAAKLVAMGALTIATGPAETAVLLTYLASRHILPHQIKSLPSPASSAAASLSSPSSSPSHATPQTTTKSISTTTTAASRQVRIDHRCSRALLRLSKHMRQYWAQLILRLYQVQLTCTNFNTPEDFDPKHGPFLFLMLNQNSMIETPALASLNPHATSYLMNYEFTWLPFVGWNLRLTGVTIDRADTHSAQKGSEEVVRLMKEENRSFYMSVEGLRSPDGGLSPYKRGAAFIALASGATVVPIITKGFRDVIPFGDWRVRPGNIEVIYEKMIPTRGIANTSANRLALTQQLWDVAVRTLTPPDVKLTPEMIERERPKAETKPSKKGDKPTRANHTTLSANSTSSTHSPTSSSVSFHPSQLNLPSAL